MGALKRQPQVIPNRVARNTLLSNFRETGVDSRSHLDRLSQCLVIRCIFLNLISLIGLLIQDALFIRGGFIFWTGRFVCLRAGLIFWGSGGLLYVGLSLKWIQLFGRVVVLLQQ